MSYWQIIKIKKMKKLLVYAICLFVLPVYAQSTKNKFKPSELMTVKFFNKVQKSELAHNKKSYMWQNYTTNWEMVSESLYEYNAKGQITKETTLDQNAMPIIRSLRTYDSQNRMISEIVENYIDNDWYANSRYNIVYDQNSTVILEEREQLINNEWVLVYGYKIESDSVSANQEIITHLSYNVDMKFYENKSQEIISKENNVISEIIYKTWDGSAWQNESAEGYDYNQVGEISNVIIVKWSDGQWHNSEMLYNISWKDAKSFLPNSFEVKTWNGVSWTNDSKIEYQYAANGGITSIGYIYEANEWKIQFGYRMTNTFDSNQRLAETITQIYEGLVWTNMSKDVFSDYRISTGIKSEKVSSINVYPNPTSDNIYFDLTEKQGEARVLISDLSGRAIIDTKIELSSTKNIDVQSLNKGYYIINLIVGEHKYQQKFAKQ